MEDPPHPGDKSPQSPKPDRKHFGLCRLKDADAEQRGEVGAWLVAEDQQILHGYLSRDPTHARHWEHKSGPHKFIQRRPWLIGRLKVRPFPSTLPMF